MKGSPAPGKSLGEPANQIVYRSVFIKEMKLIENYKKLYYGRNCTNQ